MEKYRIFYLVKTKILTENKIKFIMYYIIDYDFQKFDFYNERYFNKININQ
jgi:hypothetical protein